MPSPFRGSIHSFSLQKNLVFLTGLESSDRVEHVNSASFRSHLPTVGLGGSSCGATSWPWPTLSTVAWTEEPGPVRKRSLPLAVRRSWRRVRERRPFQNGHGAGRHQLPVGHRRSPAQATREKDLHPSPNRYGALLPLCFALSFALCYIFKSL